MSRVLVTGSKGGLGAEVSKVLMMDGHFVMGYDREDGYDVRVPDKDSLPETLDILINCAGINAQDWIGDITVESWSAVMGINAYGILAMTQALLPQLIASKGTVLNIISNASHMPMTCSLAYNASKGAAHIMTLQMARELTKKHGITVFGISPNKLRGTGMSKDIEAEVVRTRGWTPEYAEQYQRSALLTGVETDPKILAEFIGYLLRRKAHHSQLSGCIIPYGA